MCVCARLRMSERAGEGRGRVAERQRASEVSVCLEWRYPARKQSFLALCLPLAASPSPSTPLTFFSSPLFLRRAYRLASRGRRRVQWAAELNVSRAAARELFVALHFVTHFTHTKKANGTVTREASVRVRVEGRQAIPRCAPGTRLNQCRVHKTKKHPRLRCLRGSGEAGLPVNSAH